jgi:hypothetical protein
MVTATIVFFLGLGRKEAKPTAAAAANEPAKV